MKREVRWELRSIAIAVAAVFILEALFEVTDFGARMSQLSDSAWWQFIPWIALALLFGGFLVVLRRYHSSR